MKMYTLSEEVVLSEPVSGAQSNARPTGNQEVAGSIPAGSEIFCRLYEIFSTIIFLPFADSRREVVSIWWKNVHKYWLTA